MTKPNYNNLSGRLYELFSRVEERPDSEDAITSWTMVFGISEKNVSTRFHRVTDHLSLISSLLTEIESQIREIRKERGDAEIYVKHFPKIQNALAWPRLQENFQTVKQMLSPDIVDSLAICAGVLPEEDEITPDEIGAINQGFGDLFILVNESQINKTLKQWLLTLLSEGKRAIDQYQILGPRAFKKALKEIAGELTAYLPALNEVREKDANLVVKVISLMGKLKDAAAKAKEWEPLAEYLVPTAKIAFDEIAKLA